MECPKCGGKTGVIDGVTNPVDTEHYRKRKCKVCNYTFYTIEYEVENDIYFKKKWSEWHRLEKWKKTQENWTIE